jgi:hypothetical protein
MLWAVWLFAGSLLASSLDAVPDPPATRRTIQSQAAGLTDPAIFPSAQPLIVTWSDTERAAPRLAFEPVSATYISNRIALVREAADPSPPVPAR